MIQLSAHYSLRPTLFLLWMVNSLQGTLNSSWCFSCWNILSMINTLFTFSSELYLISTCQVWLARLIVENNVIPLVNNCTGLKSKGVVKTTCPRFSVLQVFVGSIVQWICPSTSGIAETYLVNDFPGFVLWSHVESNQLNGLMPSKYWIWWLRFGVCCFCTPHHVGSV